MTRLGRILRNAAEKLLKRYYEGPEPPMRLAQQVAEWAWMHPKATRAEWAAFAVRFAHGAYRDGFVRGFEWAERDLDRLQLGDPERLAELEAHDFVWHSPDHLTSQQLAEVVPRSQEEYLEKLPDDLARARYLHAVGRYTGAFRVVVLPGEPGKGSPPQARLRGGSGPLWGNRPGGLRPCAMEGA